MNSFKLIMFSLDLFFSGLERTIYGRKSRTKQNSSDLIVFCPVKSSEKSILYHEYPSYEVKVAVLADRTGG